MCRLLKPPPPPTKVDTGLNCLHMLHSYLTDQVTHCFLKPIWKRTNETVSGLSSLCGQGTGHGCAGGRETLQVGFTGKRGLEDGQEMGSRSESGNG